MGRTVVIPSLLALCLALPAAAQEAPYTSEDDQILYTLGAFTAGRMGFSGLALTPDELEVVATGLKDAALDKPPVVNLDENMAKLEEFRNRRMESVYESEVKKSGTFLETAAKNDGVERKSSGMLYQELKMGSGAAPALEDQVRVHYAGTLRDGRTFDSSIDRGQPAEFQVKGVIPCWQEALQLMKVGGRSRVYCPASIAYGKTGAGALIKPGSALVFEVELIEILN